MTRGYKPKVGHFLWYCGHIYRILKVHDDNNHVDVLHHSYKTVAGNFVKVSDDVPLTYITADSFEKRFIPSARVV